MGETQVTIHPVSRQFSVRSSMRKHDVLAASVHAPAAAHRVNDHSTVSVSWKSHRETTMRDTTAAGRRSFTAVLAGLAAAAMPAAAARAQAAGGRTNKLVIQVSDGDPHKWTLALSNAYNVLNGVAPDAAEIEIVVYGPGIGMLQRGSPVAERVASALGSGVRVVACQNTMDSQHLTAADMLPGVGYVQAAAVELMQKQQQGYAYMHP
jgi:uncharacterized protein